LFILNVDRSVIRFKEETAINCYSIKACKAGSK